MTSGLEDTLAAAAARGRPTLYLDTNVLLDIVRPQRRRKESRQLVEEWQAKSWFCVSSYFAQMEALDAVQEIEWFLSRANQGHSIGSLLRRRRDRRDLSPRELNKVSRDFYSQLVPEIQDYIEWIDLGQDAWEVAMRLATATNSSAPDCIHVAAAISRKCDALVTSDRPLGETAAGEIEVAEPREVLSWLRTISI